MKLADFNTAKALQELGYDGYYNYIYAKNTESSLRYIGFKDVFELSEYTGPPVPRLDDVAYFLRDKYRISIEPMYSSVLHGWDFTAYNMGYNGVDQLYEVYGDDYEDTLEAAVAKAIEIIKNRNNNDNPRRTPPALRGSVVRLAPRRRSHSQDHPQNGLLA